MTRFVTVTCVQISHDQKIRMGLLEYYLMFTANQTALLDAMETLRGVN